MKLVYPACFYKEQSGYSVVIPDLLGCCTQGETLEEACEVHGIDIEDLMKELNK